MKTDTTKNFSKVTGSLRKARGIVRNLLDQAELLDHWAGMGAKGKIAYARGTQNKFRWYYDGEAKTLQVTYTDGRPEPKPKQSKRTYFVIWVEGLEPRSGEKIRTLNSQTHDYTTDMTKALRVKPGHLKHVKGILKSRGVASWVLDNPKSFVKTHYAPKGTVYKP
jgi:hypothetical protein